VTFAITIAHLATVDVADETFIKTNKSVLSLLRRLSTRRCPHLLLNAGACHATAAIDRYLLHTGRSAANPPAAVAVDR